MTYPSWLTTPLETVGPTSLSIPSNHLTKLTLNINNGKAKPKLPARNMPMRGIEVMSNAEKSAFYYQQAMDNLAIARFYAVQEQ